MTPITPFRVAWTAAREAASMIPITGTGDQARTRSRARAEEVLHAITRTWAPLATRWRAMADTRCRTSSALRFP
jgi:hypothetical protein